MRKLSALCLIPFVTVAAVAGFKVKLVKPKKPEQFQVRMTASGVTFAADLLLKGGEQNDFFCKELTSSNIVAVRLAVFNRGGQPVILPLDSLRMAAPDGQDLPLIAPDTVSQAILQGKVVTAQPRQGGPVTVSPTGNPRVDRSDPRYDPRLDPTDPRYDPRMDPNDPRYPGNSPNDPRNDPRSRGGYPYPGGTWGRPGVDVVLNPGGGSLGDLSQFEKELVEKDFMDKAHTVEPVLPSLNRDRFLYFLVPGQPGPPKGYVLTLPAGKGLAQEIVLRF